MGATECALSRGAKLWATVVAGASGSGSAVGRLLGVMDDVINLGGPMVHAMDVVDNGSVFGVGMATLANSIV